MLAATIGWGRTRRLWSMSLYNRLTEAKHATGAAHGNKAVVRRDLLRKAPSKPAPTTSNVSSQRQWGPADTTQATQHALLAKTHLLAAQSILLLLVGVLAGMQQDEALHQEGPAQRRIPQLQAHQPRTAQVAHLPLHPPSFVRVCA